MRRGLGTPHGLGREAALREVRAAQAHATDVQAFHAHWLLPPADNDLRAAAADVEHQPLPVVVRQVARDALIDEPRLFLAGNDLDRMSERLLRGGQKFSGIARLPQGIRADRAHRPRWHFTQPFAEAREALERAYARRLIEPVVLVKTGGEAHHFLQPVEHVQLPVQHARHDHVKAVGTEIDGGHGLRRSRRERPDWRRQAVNGGDKPR